MSKEIVLNKKHKKIIKIYKYLFIFVYKYLLNILGIVLAILIFSLLFNLKGLSVYSESEINKLKKVNYKKNFEKLLDQKEGFEGIDIYVLQNDLIKSGGYLKSVNNLIGYKGYIMPKYVKLFSTVPIPNYSFFTNSEYKISKLEDFVKNIIFINKLEETNEYKNELIPIENNIKTDFNINCIFNNDIYKGTCNYYLNNFLDYFFVYDLKVDYNGLYNIFLKLKNSKFEKPFCDNMIKYILYSNNTSNDLENIFRGCGGKYYEEFYTMAGFIDILNEFEVGYITNMDYIDNKLNIFKILSLQQNIYEDLKNNNFNPVNIFSYIELLKNILKNNNIPDFYYDEIYWFNNYYLKLELLKNKFDYYKENINKILDGITTINKGDELIGFEGLMFRLFNNKLLVKSEKETKPQNYKIGIEMYIDQLDKLSYFSILNKKIVEEKAIVIGYLGIPVESKNKDVNIYVSIYFELINNRLIVKKIISDRYDLLEESINKIIEQNKFTIIQVYEYIKDNIELYMEENQEINICDEIKQTISDKYVYSCAPDSVDLIKEKINYQIKWDEDYKITNIKINNEKIYSGVKYLINNKEINIVNLPNAIKTIIDYIPPKEKKINKDTSNTIFIIETFQNIMGFTPKNITNHLGKYLVNFNIGGLEFIGLFDIDEKSITRLYFKNVKIKDKILSINFNLFMDQSNMQNINKFLLDPLKYIEQVNPYGYKLYLKYK